MPESIPADEGTATFSECFVNIRPTLEANAKKTELVELRMSACDLPAEPVGTYEEPGHIPKALALEPPGLGATFASDDTFYKSFVEGRCERIEFRSIQPA